MMDDMPARVFGQWAAYYDVEPWGEERADLRAALIRHTNIATTPGVKRLPKIEDLMAIPQRQEHDRPRRPAGRSRKSVDHQADELRMFFGAIAG